MTGACVLSASMSACVYQAHRLDPSFSPWVASLVRVVANWGLLALLCTRFPPTRLWGDRRPALWAWGFFGALTVGSYFSSIQSLGPGEAAFIQSLSAVFIVALCPVVLGIKNSKPVWLAVGGSFIGFALLQAGKSPASGNVFGVATGLFSAITAALAYLMIARTGLSNPPQVTVFYWSAAALLAHLLVIASFPIAWPVKFGVWIWLAVGGLQASLAQYLVTLAYRWAPANSVAALSYLTPVVNLMLDGLLFGLSPSSLSYGGASLILTFGVLLPFLRLATSQKGLVPAPSR